MLPSEIKGAGLGLFATRSLPKNTKLYFATSLHVGQCELKRRCKLECLEVVTKSDAAKNDLPADIWLALDRRLPAIFINDAPKGTAINCEIMLSANCDLLTGEIDLLACAYVQLTRDVKAGEELYTFYGNKYVHVNQQYGTPYEYRRNHRPDLCDCQARLNH